MKGPASDGIKRDLEAIVHNLSHNEFEQWLDNNIKYAERNGYSKRLSDIFRTFVKNQYVYIASIEIPYMENNGLEEFLINRSEYPWLDDYDNDNEVDDIVNYLLSTPDARRILGDNTDYSDYVRRIWTNDPKSIYDRFSDDFVNIIQKKWQERQNLIQKKHQQSIKLQQQRQQRQQQRQKRELQERELQKRELQEIK